MVNGNETINVEREDALPRKIKDLAKARHKAEEKKEDLIENLLKSIYATLKERLTATEYVAGRFEKDKDFGSKKSKN